ncbi:OmpA family protein [Aurantimonas sp. 22II-16-19i]|uniref:OmpA family protein n=1 Tax=Aurantimonas sp. 22II-16-19i TaxID=1317114 RepID=UPI0009F7A720|nr:OmpA family protein [Aurantimonas sp. 22II-16-19i]ORE97564.1 putative outer membrane protein, OmpA family [Aurantimonas sp. 22II-16-19i]
MRSILSTTALLTVLLSGAALSPQTAAADGYDAPRASAGQINRVIHGRPAGSHHSYAPRYGGGTGSHAGYRSHDGQYRHGDYGHGHYAPVDRGYGHDDRGYGHDVTDLDDFGNAGHDGRLVTTYRTFPPFVRIIETVSSSTKEPQEEMAPALAGPEPRSDVGRPILFASGSHELSPTAAADLDRIGNILLAYAETDVSILLSAYTDATGTREQNAAISARRIASVKDYLTERFDIPQARFVDAAIGEATAPGVDDPLAPENRQVVVSLLGLELDKGNGADNGAPVAEAEDEVPAAEAVYAEADHAAAAATCRVPAYPYAGHTVEGRIVAASFQDLDDFGGGRLIEVCKIGY